MTELAYVLGHPVAHSKSPVMHNAAYEALGLDWRYDFADCPTEAAARAFLDLRQWRACNVTMPYKQLAFESANVPSEVAQIVQGANVLVNWEGCLYADNTDGKGCVSYLMRCGVRFNNARVVVCGTGPTSLSILHACARQGATHICLVGRDEMRTKRVLRDYLDRADTASGEASFAARSYDRAGKDALYAADVIVDATPLGMKPNDPAPFDTSVLHAGQVVFDVVYGHGESSLLASARKAGCAAYDGAGMLVAQAVETVRDIAEITSRFSIPPDMDLFDIMAKAAQFAVV